MQETSSKHAFQNSNRHNNCIKFNINFDLEFSKIKNRINVQNSKNPLINCFAKEPMEQIASISNVENTYA
jgi:hypothetical protein